MPKLVICRGIPASGKSTWAKQWVAADPGHRVRVNRDDLRSMIHDGEFIQGITEGRIMKARDELVRAFLRAGISVVEDDTNLRARVVKDLMRIARETKADVEVRDFEESTEVCIVRDSMRTKPVGAAVINDMFNKFVKGGFPAVPEAEEDNFSDVVPYVPSGGRADNPAAVIFDIDGTLALHNGRNPYDETLVSEDTPNQPVVDMLIDEFAGLQHEIIIVSGRSAKCREATIQWIKDNIGLNVEQDYVLFMRGADDKRPDYQVKLDIFNRFIRDNYHVLRVYDDRNQVVRLWRSLGLTCFQVAEGDF